MTKKNKKLFLVNQQHFFKQVNKMNVQLCTDYKGMTHSILVKCRIHSRTFSSTPAKILDGLSCPSCNRSSRISSIEVMKKIAKQNLGKCKSKVYVNMHTKLKWECHLSVR